MSFRYKHVFASAALFFVLFLGAGFAHVTGLTTCAVPVAGTAYAEDAATPSKYGVRWGFYVSYNANSWESLKVNAKHLNYVSPYYYYLHKEGKVTGNAQAHVDTLLKQVGAKNLPMIQNVPQYNDFSAILTDTV